MSKYLNNYLVVSAIVQHNNSNGVNIGKTLNNSISASNEFRCKVCGKAFDRKSSLVCHVRTHLEDRPLTCKVCQKSFLDKAILNKHLLTENHQSPVACKKDNIINRCNVSFAGLLGETTNDTIFKCHVCNETFNDKSALSKHLFLHSSNNGNSGIHASSEKNVIEGNNCYKTLKTDMILTHSTCQDSVNVGHKDATDIKMNAIVETFESNTRQEALKNNSSLCDRDFFVKKRTRKKLLHKLSESELQTNVTRKGKKTFVCNICQGVFKDKYSLYKHYYFKNKVIQCDTTMSKDKISKQGTGKKTTGEKCYKCKKVFENKSSLSLHFCVLKNTHSLKYDVSKKVVKSNSEQGTNKKPVTFHAYGKQFVRIDEKSVKCCKCQKVFESVSSLSLHFCTFNNASQIKTYNRATKLLKCDTSKQSDKNNPSSKVIETVQTKELICDICKQHFMNKQDLTFHLHCHSVSKFVCEDCQTTFDTRKLLEVHRRSIARKQFLCQICKEVFCCGRNLINHYKVHNNAGSFSCDRCLQLFSNKFNFYLHYFSHSKNVPLFICSRCLKRFGNRNDWVSHCCAHMGTKPLNCEICKKLFLNRRNLYLHCRIHTDEKPYVCETCKKAFKYFNTMVMHQRIHTRGIS